MTSGANASVSIASTTSHHHYSGFLPAFAKDLDCQKSKVAPGILHHLKEIWSGLFHSDAVHFSHLVRRHCWNLDAGICVEAFYGFNFCHIHIPHIFYFSPVDPVSDPQGATHSL